MDPIRRFLTIATISKDYLDRIIFSKYSSLSFVKKLYCVHGGLVVLMDDVEKFIEKFFAVEEICRVRENSKLIEKFLGKNLKTKLQPRIDYDHLPILEINNTLDGKKYILNYTTKFGDPLLFFSCVEYHNFDFEKEFGTRITGSLPFLLTS